MYKRQVLKDASATAVYGVKGANGVILVTTKRGQEGTAKIEVGFQKICWRICQTVFSGTYHGEGELLLAAFAANLVNRFRKGFHDVRLDIRFNAVLHLETEQRKDDILDGHRNSVLIVRRIGMLNDVCA